MNFAIPFLFDSTTVRKYTTAGAYPLFYLDGDDSIICADCVQEQVDDGEDALCSPVVACGVNYEDEHMHCNECSAQIECAY